MIDTGTAWLLRPDTRGDGLASIWPGWGRFAQVVRAYQDAGMMIARMPCGDPGARRLPLAATRPGLLFRSIEQVLAEEDVATLAGSGVSASMQLLHMQSRVDDGTDTWATRLADRAATGYRVRDVLNAGVNRVLVSDWPVAPADPRVGIGVGSCATDPGQGWGACFRAPSSD